MEALCTLPTLTLGFLNEQDLPEWGQKCGQAVVRTPREQTSLGVSVRGACDTSQSWPSLSSCMQKAADGLFLSTFWFSVTQHEQQLGKDVMVDSMCLRETTHEPSLSEVESGHVTGTSWLEGGTRQMDKLGEKNKIIRIVDEKHSFIKILLSDVLILVWPKLKALKCNSTPSSKSNSAHCIILKKGNKWAGNWRGRHGVSISIHLKMSAVSQAPTQGPGEGAPRISNQRSLTFLLKTKSKETKKN